MFQILVHCTEFSAPGVPFQVTKTLTRISKYSGELGDPEAKFLLMFSQCDLALGQCEPYTTFTVAQRTIQNVLCSHLLSVVVINTTAKRNLAFVVLVKFLLQNTTAKATYKISIIGLTVSEG